MSDNSRLYLQKMEELRATRRVKHPLQSELEEILEAVRRCEEMWALEERIERQLGPSQ